MKAIVKRKVNDAVVEFELEGKDMKEVMLQAQPLLEDDNCWLEGFKDSVVRWETRLSKSDKGEFIYVKKVARKGTDRMASRTLGTYQGEKGHFWNKWEEFTKGADGKWVKKEGDKGSQEADMSLREASSPTEYPEGETDSVPF